MNQKKWEQNRRDFIRRTGCAALSAAAFQAGFKQFGLINAYAQAATNAPSDYKALVCIFLNGGNDSSNMVVPMGAGYTPYSTIRQSSGLAIPQASLLGPLSPPSIGGQTFGLHPNMPELLTLWSQQKLAVVPNVGPLVQPIDRTQYRAGVGRPYQLFSHSDQVQQWQTSRSDIRTQVGWGGRTADKVAFLNGSVSFPIITSVTGSTVFGQGLATRPLTISSGTPLNQVLVLNGFTTSPEDTARKNAMDLLRTIDRSATMVAAASDSTQQGVDIIASLTSDPTLVTVFPNSGLGNQMKQIAKVIKLNLTNPALGLNRQIFFASLGGFDTHQNQIGGHVQLYTQLSQAMKAFYDATVELGVPDRVTTFTLSDFGRTLQPSGSGAGSVGTDHGWGAHQFVMGGSVLGGNFYGVVRPSSNPTIFPVLALGGPDDTDNRGRYIPTVAVEQYAATMATWFGLPAADLPTVFPLLSRFTTPNLGFV